MSQQIHFRSTLTGFGAVVVAFLLAWPSLAAAAEPKIVFVNTVRVLEEAPQAEAASRKLEAEFSPRQRRLVEQQEALQRLEERLTRDEAVLTEAQRRNLERDITSQRRDLRRGEDEFREDLNLRRNEELAALQQQVFETIVALAEERSYDLVLTDGVLLASERVDITDEILARLARAPAARGNRR